jgi:transposase
LFYLPSYSPQLNPEERLNADLKQEMSKRVPVRTKAEVTAKLPHEHMTMLEQNHERVIELLSGSPRSNMRLKTS